MRISSLQSYNFYNKNLIKSSTSAKTLKSENSDNSDNNKDLNPQYYGYFPNINFCGLVFPKLSLKKSAKDYLKVGNYFSAPLENVSCNLLNKKNYVAYSIDQLKYPYGSMGIKTDFSDLIQSRDFLQCAGVVIVDKKENKQFLAHVYNKTYIEDIYETLIKAFSADSFKEKDRLDVFILPGCEKDTKYTMNHILKALDMVDDGLSLSACYVHFNKKNYDCLSVLGGKIFASDDIYKSSQVNPSDVFAFNNPIVHGYDYLRSEVSKLVSQNETVSVQKANRIYADFKKEIK